MQTPKDQYCPVVDRPLTIKEKLESNCKAYAETIDWQEEDRQDIEALSLPGDPEELRNWNR